MYSIFNRNINRRLPFQVLRSMTSHATRPHAIFTVRKLHSTIHLHDNRNSTISSSQTYHKFLRHTRRTHRYNFTNTVTSRRHRYLTFTSTRQRIIRRIAFNIRMAVQCITYFSRHFNKLVVGTFQRTRQLGQRPGPLINKTVTCSITYFRLGRAINVFRLIHVIHSRGSNNTTILRFIRRPRSINTPLQIRRNNQLIRRRRVKVRHRRTNSNSTLLLTTTRTHQVKDTVITRVRNIRQAKSTRTSLVVLGHGVLQSRHRIIFNSNNSSLIFKVLRRHTCTTANNSVLINIHTKLIRRRVT